MAATSRRSSEATFNRSGRGGVVKKFLDHTTPSARTNEASRLFLIVQPPLLLLRRGARRTTSLVVSRPVERDPQGVAKGLGEGESEQGSDRGQRLTL